MLQQTTVNASLSCYWINNKGQLLFQFISILHVSALCNEKGASIVDLIIYLEKKNYSYKLINIIFKKTLKRSYIKISRFLYKIIQLKWINIINTAIQNNVENDILQYFYKLYDLYIQEEGFNNIYIYQVKHIFKYKIGYYRHFKKYINENIYRTYYFIPFIFSKISKSHIIYNNIFEIIN